MKEILIVYDSMMTGGTTTALLSLLNEIDYNKYSVDLLLFSNSGLFLNEIPKEVNVLKPAYVERKYAFLTCSKKKILLTLLNGNAIKSVISYVKYQNTKKGNLRNILMHYGLKSQVTISRPVKKEYEVAIGFIEGWADQYVLSKKIKARKRIVWIHPDYKASYLIPEIDKKILKKASRVILVSESCYKNFCEVLPEYSDIALTIENITSEKLIKRRAEEETPPISRGRLNFCTIARCDMDVKGLDRSLNAFRKLKDEGFLDEVKWHYIGDGKDFERLKEMIDNYDLKDHVICYGQRKNPLTYLKQMNYFLLPSRYEGKPVSVDEALVLNIPCIVTSYASAHEQVCNKVSGIIADNSEEGVYEAIKFVLLHEDLYVAFRNNIKNRLISNSGEIKKLYEII